MPKFRVHLMTYYTGSQRASVDIEATSAEEAEQKVLDGQGSKDWGKVLHEETDSVELDESETTEKLS